MIKEFAHRVIDTIELYESDCWNELRIDEEDFYCEFRVYGYIHEEDGTHYYPSTSTDIITDIIIESAQTTNEVEITEELQNEINKLEKLWKL